MTLRTKTLLLISGALIGLIAVLYLTVTTVVQRSFRSLENKTVQQSLGRVLDVVQKEQDDLASIAQDYAVWDETYAFVEDSNQEYLRKNLQVEIYPRLKLNLLAIVNKSHELVFGSGYDLAKGISIPLPGGIKDYFYANSPLMNFAEADSSVSGIIMLPEGPLLVASQPILTSAGTGPVRGAVIFGRYLDDAFLKTLGSQTRLDVSASLWKNEGSDIPPDFREAQSALEISKGTIVIHRLNENVIAGYIALSDIFAKPIIILKAELPRDVYQQGQASTQALFAGLVGFGLVALFAILLLIDRSVFVPLNHLTEAISAIGKKREYIERLPSSEKDELGKLAGSINRALLEALEQRTQDLERRLMQIGAAAQLAQAAASRGTDQAGPADKDPEDFLDQTTRMIVEKVGYSLASIFYIDSAREYAILQFSAGRESMARKPGEFKIAIGSRSLIGWAIMNNRMRVSADVGADPFYLKDDLLPNTRSEVAIPISIGNNILGVLDVQSNKVNSFNPGDLSFLNTLANQIAASLRNKQLMDAVQFNTEEAVLLYQAGRQVARATTRDEIFQIADQNMRQTSFITAIFHVSEASLNKISSIPHSESGLEPFSEHLPIGRKDIEGIIDPNRPYLLIEFAKSSTLPFPLLQLLKQWQCESAAVIPMTVNEQLSALIVLGSRQKGAITPVSLEPYASLAGVMTTALQKLSALQVAEQRLAELQTVNKVSQAISSQTNLETLYQVVHDAVIQLMGEVSFLIALYDAEKEMIQIPYMIENNQRVTVEPFEIGRGLTSILIKRGKPFMLTQNAEEQAAALGAIVQGKPAKSWLGVPLSVGGDIIGAIIVQDTERQGRFDDNDMRLLSTLAAQVAIAVRNARLIETTRSQATRERLLHEVTSKIRSSVDMQTILATATTELGKALHAPRARIRVGIQEPDPPTGKNDGNKAGDISG